MSLAARGSGYGNALSEESITANATTAESLTPPGAAMSAVVSVSGENARYRLAGTPTASVGHLLVIGNQVEVYVNDLNNFQIISTTATDAEVFVTYYGN